MSTRLALALLAVGHLHPSPPRDGRTAPSPSAPAGRPSVEAAAAKKASEAIAALAARWQSKEAR